MRSAHLIKKNMKINMKNSVTILRICIGIIYVWFGILKFFPALSPAEDLAIETIQILTFGFIPAKLSLILLASWETFLGLLLISGKFLKFSIVFLILHMAATMTPLALFPELAYTRPPYAFTLVGQYILKNLIIVSGALVIYTYSRETKKIEA